MEPVDPHEELNSSEPRGDEGLHEDLPPLDETYMPEDWDVEEPAPGWDEYVPVYEDHPEPVPQDFHANTSPSNNTGTDMVPDIEGVMCRVLAATQNKPFSELITAVGDIRASETVMDELHEERRQVIDALLEMLADMAANSTGGLVNLKKVPTVSLYDHDVRALLQQVAELTDEEADDDQNPSLMWFGLKEEVQRVRAVRTAKRYLKGLENRQPLEPLLKRYRAIEAPTARQSLARLAGAKTARQIEAEKRAREGTGPSMRLSSGYRTLDMALTAPGLALGSIAPGEGFVIAGPTGTGKSSFSYGFVPSVTQDLVNWGLPFGKVIFAHTEEESIDKIRGFEMLEGQPFHHLADNLVVAAVGSSRVEMARVIYDVVFEAELRSKETGLPITFFLPYLFVLDYVQAIMEQGESDTEATAKTAEFLLRGVQQWNPEEMAKYSGLSYKDYTGSPWPEGQEHHRCGGVYFAQLVKQSDATLLYRPGQRDCQLSDFVFEDTSDNPVWRDESGSGWLWEVKEGDLRLFKQNAIRGSGILLQNATVIIILHRSRAYNNPAVDGDDGRKHIEDTRARLLLDKTRTGSQLKVVPMKFDLDWEGHRARYIDAGAEEAIARGLFTPHECWQRTSNPILPIRPTQSPFDNIRY